MTKVKTSLLVLAVIALNSCMAQSQKDLVAKIDKDIKSLEAIMRMSDTRISLTTGNSQTFSPDNERNFEQDRTKKVSDTALHQFFKKLRISSDLQYPYNMIALHKGEFDLLKLMGEESSYFMQNADMEPVFKPIKAVFLDGSENTNGFLTYNDIATKHTKTEKEDGKSYDFVDESTMSELEKYIYKGSSFSDNLAILSPKPIKSLSYEIKLPTAKKTQYRLSSNKSEIKTPLGLIRLDTIAGNQVYCSIPDTDNDRDIQIQAYYKDGRALVKKGSSSNTELTPQKRKFYLAYIDVLDKAKNAIKSEEIKTDKELEKWLKNHAPVGDKNVLENRKSVVYTFAGPVTELSFSVSDSIPEMKTFNINYELVYQRDETYFTAIDFAKQKVGLLNTAGKWIVQPQFDENFRSQNKYFYWDQYNNHQNTYWLNHQTQKIQKVNYQINDEEVYNGKYVIIEPKTNGLRGVVNAITGNVAVPMEYDNIKLKEGKYWWVKKGDQEGVLDANFKVIIPIQYDDVTVDNNYFLVKNNNKMNVYDQHGNNLTQNKYDRISTAYHNGLLLVTKVLHKSNGDTKYAELYVDIQNNIKIDPEAKGYKNPKPFSEGLAIVQNSSGNYGYINTSGNVGIPFQFKYAYGFYPTSKLALVEFKDESYALINKTGKIVKKFEGRMYDRETFSEDRKSRIKFRDNKVYNEYGEEIEYGSR